MIQCITKEKKQAAIVTGFQRDNELIQGPKLQKFLFKEVTEKFSPENLEQTFKPEKIQVEYQEFFNALSCLNDKKAQGIDGMSISYLRKLGP